MDHIIRRLRTAFARKNVKSQLSRSEFGEEESTSTVRSASRMRNKCSALRQSYQRLGKFRVRAESLLDRSCLHSNDKQKSQASHSVARKENIPDNSLLDAHLGNRKEVEQEPEQENSLIKVKKELAKLRGENQTIAADIDRLARIKREALAAV